MQSDDTVTSARAIRFLQGVSLFLLAAIVALRPLISESYDSAASSVTRAVESIADPAPARTLGLDLAILIAACLWLVAFALETRRYRWTGLEPGLALLAIAGAASCMFAGQKRLAINGTVDWLCLPILTIGLTQLLRTERQRRLILAALLATAVVQAAQCYEQYFIGFAETIEQYEAEKEEFWGRQGVDLDSTTVEAFERRLRAREASGFFAHSNIAGAYLMLCAFAAVGLFASRTSSASSRLRWARADSLMAPLVTLLLAVAMGCAVFLTGSLGAVASGAVAMAIFLIAIWKRDWMARHRRGIIRMGGWTFLLGAIALVAHGIHHDSLPGWSLTFRWQYWKASAAMIADHAGTGVGRENFGRHYTLYKDIASPEEVANPHNVFVQSAAEWGWPGLVAVLAMLVGVLHRASRPSGDRRLRRHEHQSSRGVILWAAAIWAVIVTGRAVFLGSNDPNFLFYSTATTGIIWLPAFAAFLASATGNSPAAATAIPSALGAGLLAFLLQDMISFALFIPASATTFFAVLAVWLSGDEVAAGAPVACWPRGRWYLAALAIASTLLFGLFVFSPVLRCNRWVEKAKRLAVRNDRNRGDAYRIEEACRRAALADPLDPTPWVEQARWLAGKGDPPSLSAALDSLSQAILRDPKNASLRRQQSRLFLSRAGLSGKPDDYLAAVQSAKAALALYPQDPSGMVSLADTERTAGLALGLPDLLHSAQSHYQQALDLDARRLEWETIQRFRPKAIADIKAKLEKIREAAPHP